MTYVFGTVTDKNYLIRALALYESCKTHCGEDFTLWVVCLDEETRNLLEKLSLPHIHTLAPEELRDEELLAIRSDRTIVEFSWTLKPSLLTFLLTKTAPGAFAAYLDADTFFFASPESFYRAHTDASLMIVPHHFPPSKKEREALVGIFNAGVLFFRNDANAKECLAEWRKQCLAWCYNRKEPGRFGDQIYLEAWPKRYTGVRILAEKGADAGPWNIGQYQIREKVGVLWLDEDPLILFHFHGLILYRGSTGIIGAYPVSMGDSRLYKPYLAALRSADRLIQEADPSFSFALVQKPGLVRFVKQYLFRLFA